jgi:hypothetical protein
MITIFSISLYNSSKVISYIILIAALCVANCSSKSMNKNEEKSAIVSEYLLERQTPYGFVVTQDYPTTSTEVTHAHHHPKSRLA